jgi:hypothetical protein
MAGKNLDPQFFFQFDDGFGHPGLGCVQGLGGFCEVQIAAGGLLDKAKLVKVHTLNAILIGVIML